MAIYIIPDLEGRYIHGYVNEDLINGDEDRICLIGDILDSTKSGNYTNKNIIDYSSHNIHNIYTTATNSKVILFFGNRDLTKLSLFHSLKISELDDNDYKKKFNSGDLELSISNFDQIGGFRKIKWEHDSILFHNLDKQFNKKDINNGVDHTFMERYDQTIGNCGVNEFFIECMIKELNIPITIFEEIDRSYVKDYKAFLIMGILKSMFIKVDINTVYEPYEDMIKKFSEDYNPIIFKGMLYKIFIDKKNRMVSFINNRHLISHGGITKYTLSFFNNENTFNKFKIKELEELKNFTILNAKKNAKETILDLTTVFTDTVSSTTLNITTVESIGKFINNCNKSFKKLFKQILEMDDFFKYITILKCMISELDEECIVVVSSDKTLRNNFFSPIGPGIIELAGKFEKLINKVMDKREQVVQIIQIFGHKPISCANSIFSKNEHYLINLDTTNSFNNTITNKKCSSYNYAVIKDGMWTTKNNDVESSHSGKVISLLSNIDMNITKKEYNISEFLNYISEHAKKDSIDILYISYTEKEKEEQKLKETEIEIENKKKTLADLERDNDIRKEKEKDFKLKIISSFRPYETYFENHGIIFKIDSGQTFLLLLHFTYIEEGRPLNQTKVFFSITPTDKYYKLYFNITYREYNAFKKKYVDKGLSGGYNDKYNKYKNKYLNLKYYN